MALKTLLHFSDNGSQVGTHYPNIESAFKVYFFQQSFPHFLGLLHEHHNDVNKVTVVQSLYF